MSPKRKKAADKKTSTSKKASDQSLSDKIQNLNITKSYTSLAYGVVTVVVLFILVVVGIRTFANQEKVEITDDSAVTQAQGDKYIVKNGQTLWDIAEEVYGTGFEWERIAKANNMDNPGQIVVGSALIIPRIEDNEDNMAMDTSPTVTQSAPSPTLTATSTPTTRPTETNTQTSPTKEPTKVPTSTPMPTSTPSPTGTTDKKPISITAKKYTVVEGDTLWDIAVRARADGYRWVDIYRANQSTIANPDLIFVGQVIVLPAAN